MTVVRQVKSQIILPAQKKEVKETEKPPQDREQNQPSIKSSSRKKVCFFCQNKLKPVYWDVVALRQFISDRGRIISRNRRGACAKHQRKISKAIKQARHLALLPYTIKT